MSWGGPKECEGDECGYVIDYNEQIKEIEARRIERNALVHEINMMKSAFNKVMRSKRIETAHKIAAVYASVYAAKIDNNNKGE